MWGDDDVLLGISPGDQAKGDAVAEGGLVEPEIMCDSVQPSGEI